MQNVLYECTWAGLWKLLKNVIKQEIEEEQLTRRIVKFEYFGQVHHGGLWSDVLCEDR